MGMQVEVISLIEKKRKKERKGPGLLIYLFYHNELKTSAQELSYNTETPCCVMA